ncbi:MAG TPA: hypothetical protein PKY82_15820 [Pyrinomonadaceae bacterium]|nr:hypothetical protein [Pyrinomonadaceae bacterium]
MKKFLRIAEQIPVIFGQIITKYGFKLFIFKDRLELLSLNCTILIKRGSGYPDSETFIINPKAESKNLYELWKIMQLRKIPFRKGKLDYKKDSFDACRIEDLQITVELLSLCCFDAMEGNFKNLEEEGYWELHPLTFEDVAFILKNERFPD